MMPIDLSGQQFARLTAQWPVGRGTTCARGAKKFHPEIQWLCICSCGTLTVVKGNRLRRGVTQSCGCLKIRHGHTIDYSRSRTWITWKAMRDRCTQTTHKSYPRYGGRGIKICERWEFFELFLADVGVRPEGKSLDRFPNPDGNYQPGNVRWATPKEQGANRGQRVAA